MNRGRAEIIDAILHLDRPAGDGPAAQREATGAGAYSPAQERAASAGEHVWVRERAGDCPLAHEAPGGHGADSSAGLPADSHDVGMVLVAYDAGGSHEARRRKLSKHG